MQSVKELITYLMTLDNETLGHNSIEIITMAVYETLSEMISGKSFSFLEFIKKLPKHFIDGVVLKLVSNKIYDYTLGTPKKRSEKGLPLANNLPSEHPIDQIMGGLNRYSTKTKKELEKDEDFINVSAKIPLGLNRYYHQGLFLAHQ